MPKKGVEPAALRRWRLAHRKGKKGKHRSHPKVRRHFSMARRRHRRRGRHSFKIPVITVAILAGQALAANATGDWGQKLNAFQAFYTGFDFNTRQFYPQLLIAGYGPWLAKGLISKIARPMGAAPRVPFGLPISIS